MRVLIACEYSGEERDAFIARGHEAVSCDLLPTDRPGPHYQGDVFDIIGDGWDMMIAHPPCTYLTNSGVRWLYKPHPVRNEARWQQLAEGAAFFKRLLDADTTYGIPKVCVENPIPHMHAVNLIGEDFTQLVQPWQFGHRASKATCYWLKGLPPLVPTDIVGPPPPETNPKHPHHDPALRRQWFAIHLAPPGPERWKFRSTTFSGIARAMAAQWG